MNVEIRESTGSDIAELELLYPAAFPEEALLPLVRSLLADPATALSLVATIDGTIVGHAMLTRCRLTGSPLGAALLGPVAVAPGAQRHGIGSLLIETGLQRLRDARAEIVLVLGDPAYYQRFGFAPESRVSPPFRLPAEWADAWQCLALGERGPQEKVVLVVPPQWEDPALWGP